MFRRTGGAIEVFLAHPGGPFWRNRDEGAWTIPKGEYVPPETPLEAALREWQEETGFPAHGPFLELGEVRLKSGKRITAWAFEGDADAQALRCNLFELEWPPRSGRMQSYPELDRAGWFTLEEAAGKIGEAQAAFLHRLAALVTARS